MSIRKSKPNNRFIRTDTNTTLMRLVDPYQGDVSLQVLKDETGYHIAMTSANGYSMKRITKKTHDLLIKALTSDK